MTAESLQVEMPERPVRMENNNQKPRKEAEKCPGRRSSSAFAKKFGRKRSKSFSGGNGYTCRLRPMLPTKFLLGGNICDPLNLNSLQDEEVNRTANAVTPKSSPIPTPPQRRGPIDVLIPPNINDPLNLIDCDNDREYEQQLMSPYKKGGKRRKKKKRTVSATTEISDADVSSASEAKTPDKSVDSAKIPVEPDESSPPANLAKVTKDLKLELSPQKDKKRKSFDAKDPKKARRLDAMDKIVSPVVPQPGTRWVKRPPLYGRAHRKNGNGEKMPQFKPKNTQYQYGNYNRYYGYRNPNREVDPRLKLFAEYPLLFHERDILDIGCNIGHITLSIARDFGAKSVVGLDIDKKLIGNYRL